MPTYTIGGGGNFATITAALASGLVVPGDTLALLSGYNTENATVGIENLTFSGDASNTGIALMVGAGIMAITLTGTAPIDVFSWNPISITGNDGSNLLAAGPDNDIVNGGAGADTLAGGPGNDIVNGGAGADVISYQPGEGIDTIDGGADHDTLFIFGTTVYYDDWGKGFGGDDVLTAVVEDGTITSINGGTLVNVESVILDLRVEYNFVDFGTDTLDYTGTTEAVTVNLATGTATGFTSIAGVERVLGGSGNDVLTGDAGLNFLMGGLGADTFGFSFAADSVVGAPDVIADWESSDIIDLAAIDANTNLVGNQDFTFLGLGAADLTVSQGQLKYYHAGGNTYVVGNVTADNQADFQIQINGVHTLAIDDFIL
jgi:Ca2+-binding RTX toxin-like protein